MRLLICVAQAALGNPKDGRTGSHVNPTSRPRRPVTLDTWQHRFNLFGRHAFCRWTGWTLNQTLWLTSLIVSLASGGNNPTLFDHGSTPGGRVQTEALLALNLLVYQMFSCGGTFSETVWDNVPTPRHVLRSPCVEEAMAHTLLRGRNIVETVHLNLLTEEQTNSLPNMERGRPCWEETRLGRESSEKQTSSFLGRLVPVSRAIRLFKDSPSIVLGEALRYPQLPEQRDPFGTVYDTGKQRMGKSTSLTYLSVNPEAAAWRELASILSLQVLDSKRGRWAHSTCNICGPNTGTGV